MRGVRIKRGRERNTYRESQREQYVERETTRAKVQWTTGRGREKSGEIEESRESDVEGETCHVCIEREK